MALKTFPFLKIRKESDKPVVSNDLMVDGMNIIDWDVLRDEELYESERISHKLQLITKSKHSILIYGNTRKIEFRHYNEWGLQSTTVCVTDGIILKHHYKTSEIKHIIRRELKSMGVKNTNMISVGDAIDTFVEKYIKREKVKIFI